MELTAAEWSGLCYDRRVLEEPSKDKINIGRLLHGIAFAKPLGHICLRFRNQVRPHLVMWPDDVLSTSYSSSTLIGRNLPGTFSVWKFVLLQSLSQLKILLIQLLDPPLTVSCLLYKTTNDGSAKRRAVLTCYVDLRLNLEIMTVTQPPVRYERQHKNRQH